LGAGIGFPLLFGSGPGSILGGAIGSAGGFGTQILASAIGGIIDQAVADVAKLGQAFTKTGLDADALAKAIGDVSGSTKKLIDETKEVSGSQAAAEAAAKLMAAAIGDDAVTALTSLGDASNELGSAVAILGTEFQALAATILGPVTSALAKGISRTNQINAADRITAEGGEGAARLRAAAERGAETSVDPIQGAIDARLAEAAKIQAEEQAKIKQEITDTNIEKSKTLDILEAEGQILDLNKNLLDDKTLALTKGNIELKYAAKLEKEGLTELEKKVLEQEKLNELKGVDNKVTQQQLAADRKAEADARKAANEQKRLARETEQARQKELQTLQTISQLDLKAYDIAIQTIRATEGESAAIKEQLSNMDALLAKRIEVINLSNKDQRIKEIEVALAEKQIALEQITLRNKQQEIALQRELNKLKAEQQVDAIQTGLDQELAGLSLGGNAQTDLLQEQANRYKNTLKDINNQIEQQNLLIENTPTPNQEAINAATTQLDTLEKTKSAYEAMLPQIFAAEQAQLKYNQAFAAISPAVNSLVGGLQEVVAGTKTAEEAFADFLNTIADQLISTAATMIAQYIAIGIARLFATGGTSPIPKGTLPGTNFFEARTPGLATGGFVTSPTQATVGEGGQPEYVIPANKMDSAMSRYSTGARGDAVVGGANAVESSDSLPAEQPSQINISGGVMQVDNTNYIRQDQIPAIVDQASKQGEARALRRLQMSPTARRKVGV
jgi:hypothetical protein